MPACAALLMALVGVPRASGQGVDTLRNAVDTVRAVDSVATRPALPHVGFAAPEPGRVLGDSLPIRLPTIDAAELLQRAPGAFIYELGVPGWPDGWSPLGLAPHQATVTYDGLPFDDLYTGAPRFTLLPLAFTGPWHLEAGRSGYAVAVHTTTRPYDVPRPLTELRYVAGGMQSIEALHAQRRHLRLFGREGVLHVAGAYFGRGAKGEYEGTRLERARRVLLRLRYERPRWSVALHELSNQRRVGAHSGILPGTTDPNSIYFPLVAIVQNPRAVRRTVRNDVALTARFYTLPEAPFSITAFRTAESHGYRNDSDTLDVRSHRTGFRLQQALTVGGHRMRMRVEGWRSAVTSGTFLPSGERARRDRLDLAFRDSVRLSDVEASLRASFHVDGTRAYPGAAFDLSRRAGHLRLFASATLTGQPLPPAFAHGFGGYLQPASDLPESHVLRGQVGAEVVAGSFGVSLTAYAGRTGHPVDLFVTAGDSAAVVAVDRPFERAGLVVAASWRAMARRGLYLTSEATLLHFLNGNDSASHQRVARTLPTLYGHGRLGARLHLFRGDLKADVYLRGRFWSEMSGRTFQPQTGLFTVPLSTAGTLGPNAVLDAAAEARVRSATFFFLYENALSGTTLQPGVVVVPVYPLPSRQFRFGVYWPIWD